MTDASIAKVRVLSEQGFYLTTPTGHSMRPFIRADRDQVLVRPLVGRAVRGDVLLYVNGRGEQVLHRVIRPIEGGSLIRGDACYTDERVPAESVLGRMEVLYRGDREISVRRSVLHRLAVCLWLVIYPLRYALNRLRRGRKA